MKYDVSSGVYFRDTSSLLSPGCAVRYHLPSTPDIVTALCSVQIMLDEGNATTVTDAGPLFCKRCARISGIGDQYES